jgi:hypothetical protein
MPVTFPPLGGLAHAATHEDGGTDEIDVTGLSGLLADPQDAGSVLGVAVDDSAIGDGKVLVFRTASGDLEYEAAGSYTDEQAQDAVGGILVDSGTIDFSYTDATPEITADVIESGVDITNLGGYPGGSATFLRADGTFASPGSGGSPIAPTVPEGTPAVWFYADDVNITVDGSNQPTLIPNNGALGGNFTLDATATKRGTIVAVARNGLAVLRLDGTDDYLKMNFSAVTDAEFQVFVVGKRTALVGNVSPRIFSLVKATGANSDFQSADHATAFVFNGSLGNDYWVLYRDNAYRVNSDVGEPRYQIGAVIWEAGGDGVATYSLGINGGEWESLITDATASTGFDYTDLLVGAGYHGSALASYNRMDVYEVLLYTGAGILTPSERALTRRYLANKWGVPIQLTL